MNILYNFLSCNKIITHIVPCKNKRIVYYGTKRLPDVVAL